eukprot:gene4130-4457_t
MSSDGDEITTIFIVGFSWDVKEREVTSNRPQAFVVFDTRQNAEEAMHDLQ